MNDTFTAIIAVGIIITIAVLVIVAKREEAIENKYKIKIKDIVRHEQLRYNEMREHLTDIIREKNKDLADNDKQEAA